MDKRPLVYAHPDGDVIEYVVDDWQLVASDGETSTAVVIGPVGLVELGRTLIALGRQLDNHEER